LDVLEAGFKPELLHVWGGLLEAPADVLGELHGHVEDLTRLMQLIGLDIELP